MQEEYKMQYIELAKAEIVAVEADRIKAHPKTLLKRLCNPFSNFTILVFCYFWTVCGIKCLGLLSKALMAERVGFEPTIRY